MSTHAHPRSRVVRSVAAATMAGLAIMAAAGPASANSFERRVHEGKVWYNDGKDRFCVRADEVGIHDRSVIVVKLRPDNTSRGPTLTVSDDDRPGTSCVSLARAYEDTHYTAVIKSELIFDRGGNTTWEVTRVGFYS